MGDCSNFECSKTTWGDRYRCSVCRRLRNYTCASCGDNVPTLRAIRCKDCTEFNHNEVTYKSIKKRRQQQLNNGIPVT